MEKYQNMGLSFKEEPIRKAWNKTRTQLEKDLAEAKADTKTARNETAYAKAISELLGSVVLRDTVVCLTCRLQL